MAAEKPDNQGGCQLSREQLASRLERLEGLFTKMSDMYEKRISALEKEVSSVKKRKRSNRWYPAEFTTSTNPKKNH